MHLLTEQIFPVYKQILKHLQNYQHHYHPSTIFTLMNMTFTHWNGLPTKNTKMISIYSHISTTSRQSVTFSFSLVWSTTATSFSHLNVQQLRYKRNAQRRKKKKRNKAQIEPVILKGKLRETRAQSFVLNKNWSTSVVQLEKNPVHMRLQDESSSGHVLPSKFFGAPQRMQKNPPPQLPSLPASWEGSSE